MGIYSCKGCVAPKRYPGCHVHCPDYLAEKAKHDTEKAEIEKRKYIEYGLDCQCARGFYRAMKIRHKKG